jgi:hypothetical protein
MTDKQKEVDQLGASTKKEISKCFRELEKNPDFKVWNFSDRGALRKGMEDWLDIVVIGNCAFWYLELKREGDKYSPGQLDTRKRILMLERISKVVKHRTLTENNYLTIRDEIIQAG